MAMNIFWSPWAHVMAVIGSCCEEREGERERERGETYKPIQTCCLYSNFQQIYTCKCTCVCLGR